MKCPSCGNEDTRVVDTRALSEGMAIRRRRECEQCDFRFSTHEQIELLNLKVKKRDGEEQLYDRLKLERGISRALEKRPVEPDTTAQLITAVERDIQLKAKSDMISSEDIGEIVMKHLKRLDKVAFIRFASVYRQFEDLEEFREEVDKLLKKKR